MTQTQHTPGPWEAWDDCRTVGITSEDGEPIAVLEIVDHGDMADPAQLRADQALAAAAPELLASLKWTVGMAEEAIMVREAGDDEADTPDIIAMHREELEKARDAIAKARGEG